MSIARPKANNDYETVTMFVELPFADLGIVMDEEARELFDARVIRGSESFPVDIKEYVFCLDRIIMFVEFPAKCNFTLEQLTEKLLAWVGYCPWQAYRTVETYIEKNAFNIPFVLGNIFQCFSIGINRLNRRKNKVTTLYKSLIISFFIP